MNKILTQLLIVGIVLTACTTSDNAHSFPLFLGPPPSPTAIDNPTAIPTRPNFKPGEWVNYTAQSGDTLHALAARFNTTIDEIMAANPIIPKDATTMPPGFPMMIPIYYRALWSSAYQIMPDAAFVDGPVQIGFNTSAFVDSHSGWWKNYIAYAGGQYRTGAEIVDYVATNYSISP
ncbi:MAG: LysM peptidoglycan-binding domain-containing protein, partial [Anaerolineales bacterium]